MQRHRCFPGLLALAAFFQAVTPAAAPAQEGVVLPELPFVSRMGIGARSAGMGFAYGAVAEDGSSLFYNPAGLAQIRRIEISGGLVHDSQDREVTFDTATDGFAGTGTTSSGAKSRATQVSHLSLAYPFPTYRGSLVMGLAYQRVAPLKSDYYREGSLRRANSSQFGIHETESFTENGSVNFWTAGLAGDVSPHISLGASLTYIQGNTLQDFEIGRLRGSGSGPFDVEGSDEVFLSSEIRDADLTGFTGSIGALARASDRVRVALTVDLPQRYEFNGVASTRFEDQEKIDNANTFFQDVITLPISLLASLAITPRNFLLAADFRVTDWTQIDFEGTVQKDRENAYRGTLDVHLGAEYQLPVHPTRLRVGFSSQPLPYRLQAADIDFTFVPDDGNANTTDDASFFTRDYPDADITTDRSFITLGAGTLVDETVTLDLAYIHGTYERSGGNISEKWTTNRIVGTATFRF